MAVYSSWEAVKLAIQQKMRKAMDETKEKSYFDMFKETDVFYDGGEPDVYVRTWKFGDAPDFTDTVDSGNYIYYELFMNGFYNYDTGSFPSGFEVFQWAEEGSHGIVGTPNTWERIEEDVQRNMDKAFGRYFDSI